MPFQIIKPDTEDQQVEKSNTTIFLAGSIDNGAASLWAHDVQQAMSEYDDVTLWNPRREHWLTDLVTRASEPIFNEQVNWELDRIEDCDIPFFYFEAGSVSPITLQELGFVIGTRRGDMTAATAYVHKPVVVCPEKYWRRGNVEIMCARHDVRVYDTLDEGIEALKIAVQVDRSWRAKAEWREIEQEQLLRDAVDRHG
jgi:hypothetical protein